MLSLPIAVYQLQFTKKAKKDIQSLSPKLKAKLKDILRYKIALKPESGKPEGVLFGKTVLSRQSAL
jgi:mRNA-degrading endonuclease RelE of RelBE toxin-antitoxin system